MEETEIEIKIEYLEKRLNKRINKLENNLYGLSSRVTKLTSQLNDFFVHFLKYLEAKKRSLDEHKETIKQ